jgi:Heparinase II/III-like protein/Heparinase II/III N-terminus
VAELMVRARTLLALGLPNLARVASYRLLLKSGLKQVSPWKASVPQGPFYQASGFTNVASPPVETWQSSALLFSFWPYVVSEEPPDWLANPLTGRRIAAPEREWWQIPDFDTSVGDIKVIWELSRMDWVPAFAQRVRNGDDAALARLNRWLADWCSKNPPYRGPNWKCGQEASIRVMQLAVGALILGQATTTTPALRDLVHLHLRRIAPTMQYAVAQDNNHGTSEAAALFIGGSWLAQSGVSEGERWRDAGRRWLEDRVARLIGLQGTFSQYSLNYHRLMLDTLCIAEVWRRALVLPAFSAVWQQRALAATHWLHSVINPVNGDGPNVGANDGARLLQLVDAPYRDYRHSVQFAMALFAGMRAYPDTKDLDSGLHWLGVPVPGESATTLSSRAADDGGFAVLRRGPAMAMLRYPRFKFRPSHADALHVDLWLGPDNLLRDAGSYSYNTDREWIDYFSGTAGHNTVQFDQRDQMPRLSRFLFGDWLETSLIEALREEGGETSFGAAYRDRYHAGHSRRISLCDTHLRVVDKVDGFARSAVLRWRLLSADWQLSGQQLKYGAHELSITATVPVKRCELVSGWESRHYLEKTRAPVLEVEIDQPGTLVTEYRWAA